MVSPPRDDSDDGGDGGDGYYGDLAIVAVKNLTVSHHQVDQTCETSKSRLDTFATAS